jgi:cytochrome b subunit of formate dehydrogenase
VIQVMRSNESLFLLTLFFLILCPFTVTSHSDELKSEDCLMCHETMEPLVDKSLIDASIHSGFECTDCHQDVTEIPHEEVPKNVDCSSCHPDIAKEYSESIHGEARARGDRDAPTCTSCHGSHGILPKDNPKSSINPLNIPATCSNCHTSEKITKQHPLPSPEFIESYSESVHGRGVLVSGLVVSAVCSDCHGAHDIRPKTDKNSSVYRENIPLTCKKCHLGIYDDYERSVHGQLWKEGFEVGPVCTTCHKSHQITEPVSAGFRLQISEECSGCHEARALTYRDTFHGQSTSLGFVQVAKCSDCHTPHLNLPEENPLSSVYSGNLIDTCGKCHSNINKKFITYDPHADPHDKDRSPLLYYVNTLMNWLLISVFGFFGLHLVLWLQRSAVAVARGEIPTHWSGDKYVRRFSLPHRITHVTLVISFLGLAATGLPLMYNYTAWGKILEGILGGVEVTRYFHRFFAIVTLGYISFHLGYMLDKIFLKGNISLLYGPNSMIPRSEDIVDLYKNIRWFLYLGPRPKLDRWTYWEKFDYFAVFWGIPVIGFSGLMLWFPEVFTKILPGYFLNVAMVVHGEEALLAVGFIFTFHFFHTHLRPESFPLDTVIFTGKIPLERFIEERPEEYNRILKEGRLEEIIVEPPSQLAIMFSKWFGFAALGVGLILIIAIFATFLANI